jgi:hypothetical protein
MAINCQFHSERLRLQCKSRRVRAKIGPKSPDPTFTGWESCIESAANPFQGGR